MVVVVVVVVVDGLGDGQACDQEGSEEPNNKKQPAAGAGACACISGLRGVGRIEIVCSCAM